MIVLRLSLFAALALAPALAYADNLTYNVSVVDPNNSGNYVTGTVITDGKQGSLQARDFVSESLTFTFGGVTQPATGPFQVLFSGNPQVTATSAGLFVNLDYAQPSLFTIDIPAGPASGGRDAAIDFCIDPAQVDGYNCGSSTATINFGYVNQAAYFQQVGNYEFAAAPLAATPEPSSLALFATGVLGIAYSMRRRVTLFKRQ